ncbi:YbaB/EbfC family nucleoid-associated protein [Haloechinothrix salitolerans]|uniref:YbaB/EbfC family nucleoid-associated protein n=1 Tax=Haloechinothrix salitolerans TaxID=926830 RepID=A0ABW2C5L6_9PSEU
MSEPAERLLRRIEAIDTAAADNRRRTESYQRMSAELAEVTGTATSPDGVVTVVTDAAGTVKDIQFTEATRTVSPAALSASVVHTIASARAAAARSQAEVVRRGLGDTTLLDRVLDEDATLFGDRRPPDPGPPPVPRPEPRVSSDDDADDDYDFGAVLR